MKDEDYSPTILRVLEARAAGDQATVNAVTGALIHAVQSDPHSEPSRDLFGLVMVLVLSAPWVPSYILDAIGSDRENFLEDVGQETCIKVFLHRDTYDETQLFIPWLRRIVRNVAIDRFRKERQRIDATDSQVEVGDTEEIVADGRQGDAFAAAEIRINFSHRLQRLPHRERDIVRAYLFKDQTHVVETAGRFGITPTRVRQILRKLLTPDDHE